MVRVKICGCRKPADALAAADAGAAYAGVVFAERLRRVTPAQAAGILTPARGRVRVVGVFVDAAHETILTARDVAGLDIAQLHGRESVESCAALREAGLEVWKAVRPRSAEELAAGLERYADAVDAILVEGFSEAAAGGTGTGFPLDWLAPLRERLASDDDSRGYGTRDDDSQEGNSRVVGSGSPGPRGGVVARPSFVLAGGLTPDNVRETILRARPSIVDVSSGVERAPGEKDPALIERFVAAASTP